MSELLVHRFDANAKLPTRATPGSAGYDLYCVQDTLVPATGQAVLVKTGIAIAVPEGLYGRIAPRSGLALKHSITTGAGVIDSDYRGEVGVVLMNHGPADYVARAGDRVAQLILERIATPDVREVDHVGALSSTSRGAGGYGSTGT